MGDSSGMLSSGYKKQVKRLRKLAAKNEFCLILATCILAVYVFFCALWRHIKTPVWRIVVAVLVCICLMWNTSYSAESYFDAIDYDNLYNEYGRDAELAEYVEDGEEVLVTEAAEEDDMASLDDLYESTKGEVEVSDESKDETPVGPTFNKSDWNLMLVNKTHSIPDDYTFTLGTIKGSLKCDERIITPLTDMFKAAAGDGVNLIVCSPYRDISLQEKLFDRKMKKYIASGYSYMDAYKEASAVVTVPGTSEHQLGLALDIVCDYYSQLNAGFGETEAGKWLMDNAYKYGFILRYPKDKEEITGIIYEPWHYRYVGVAAATIIHDNNMCLEEFIESL